MHKYKKISKNIEELTIDNPKSENQDLKWVNIKNAGKSELEFLRKKFLFDLPHLQASSGKTVAQRPIVRLGNGYLFLIIHFPVINNGTISAGEIEFFVGHGYLITVHNNNLPSLNNFFNSCKKESENLLAYQLESSAILLYEVLDKLVSHSFSLLDKNSIDMEKIEDMIFAQQQKQATSEILYLRRNIINFRKIMQNHKNIIKKLMEMESSIVPLSELKKRYNRLVDRTKRIWESLDNQKEMIEALHDTNDSLLNYKISDIMKTLTVFSVIVFPLTLFAAIFGMNTIDGMPFVDNPYGFWIIISLMLLACFGMLMFFKKKKWL